MKVKPAVIALLLIGLMVGSTFVFAILQSVHPPIQLPKTNIINYKLDPNLRYGLIQFGATILTFEYSSWCENCSEQKNFLEFLATNYRQRVDTDIYNIYLEEILDETVNQSKLTIVSLYGNRTFVNPTENETFNALCDLMSYPPIDCVTK